MEVPTQCDTRCGQTLTRDVWCFDPRTYEERDPDLFCGDKEKPQTEYQCAPCTPWIKESGECQYSSTKKSCRLNQAVKPFTWVCPSGNCGPKPPDPVESEYEQCTMPCLAYTVNRGGCQNEPPYKSTLCAVGQGYQDVAYTCDYDNNNVDMCIPFPEENGRKPCNDLPRCLAWTRENQYPSQPCRRIDDKNFTETCGYGQEHYKVTCPQPNMCNPQNVPSATEECMANQGCFWRESEWRSQEQLQQRQANRATQTQKQNFQPKK